MGSSFPFFTARGRACALVGMRKPTYSIHGKELCIKDMLVPADIQPGEPLCKSPITHFHQRGIGEPGWNWTRCGIKEPAESHVFITVTKSNWWEEGFTVTRGPEVPLWQGRMMAEAAEGCGGEKLLTSVYIRVQREGKKDAFSLFPSFKTLSIQSRILVYGMVLPTFGMALPPWLKCSGNAFLWRTFTTEVLLPGNSKSSNSDNAEELSQQGHLKTRLHSWLDNKSGFRNLGIVFDFMPAFFPNSLWKNEVKGACYGSW